MTRLSDDTARNLTILSVERSTASAMRRWWARPTGGGWGVPLMLGIVIGLALGMKL